MVENGNTYGIDPETILWDILLERYGNHQGFISDISELPSNIQNLAGSIGGTIEGNSGNDGYSSEISGIIRLQQRNT